eukprot:1873257-Pleurochrysis_carterae.AAC.1
MVFCSKIRTGHQCFASRPVAGSCLLPFYEAALSLAPSPTPARAQAPLSLAISLSSPPSLSLSLSVRAVRSDTVWCGAVVCGSVGAMISFSSLPRWLSLSSLAHFSLAPSFPPLSAPALFSHSHPAPTH